MYTSYSFIDASTKDYQEEEVYFEEEEENFDHYTNQGKLYSCKLPKCKALLEQGTITYYFMFNDPNLSFYRASFWLWFIKVYFWFIIHLV